jgi:hypothetical protein
LTVKISGLEAFEQADPLASRLGYLDPAHRRRWVSPADLFLLQLAELFVQSDLKVFDAHAVNAGLAPMLLDPLETRAQGQLDAEPVKASGFLNQ